MGVLATLDLVRLHGYDVNEWRYHWDQYNKRKQREEKAAELLQEAALLLNLSKDYFARFVPKADPREPSGLPLEEIRRTWYARQSPRWRRRYPGMGYPHHRS